MTSKTLEEVGISLRRVEIESFIKSFLLFFISISSVVGFLHYQTYQTKLQQLENTIFSQMQLTNLGGKTLGFTKQVVQKEGDLTLHSFYSDGTDIFVFFENRDSNNSLIKISYPLKNLDNDDKIIFQRNLKIFLQSLVVIAFLSILFSLYALNPFKKYLKLTDEFIKDILHDFNTPISTIRLNTSLLKSKQNNKNLQRIEGGVETILNLQNNLKEYLENDIKQSEKFSLKETVMQRIAYMQGVFPHIHLNANLEDKTLYCYKDGFIRIIDNILSNACKYNKKDGSVTVSLKENMILEIQDTGSGIRNPKKIFNRFYKETSRGLGIGLHLVKKLSQKMHMSLHVDSEVGTGTTFKLDLKNLILN